MTWITMINLPKYGTFHEKFRKVLNLNHHVQMNYRTPRVMKRCFTHQKCLEHVLWIVLIRCLFKINRKLKKFTFISTMPQLPLSLLLSPGMILAPTERNNSMIFRLFCNLDQLIRHKFNFGEIDRVFMVFETSFIIFKFIDLYFNIPTEEEKTFERMLNYFTCCLFNFW